MRVLQSTTDDEFRVKAYAGTNGVLLAFDLSPEQRAGCLGFAVEQKEAGKPWQHLLNSLTFPGQAIVCISASASSLIGRKGRPCDRLKTSMKWRASSGISSRRSSSAGTAIGTTFSRS